MTQHALVGRLGGGDREVIALGGYAAHEIDLVVGARRLGHGLGNSLEDLKDLGLFPTELGVDLLVLGSLVYAADTRVSRQATSQDSWTREIMVVVPVSDPDRWQPTSDFLQRMLNFLTGDRWAIRFRARPSGFEQIAPTSLLADAAPPFSTVALFSGGLDSLIGAIDLLHGGAVPLLVSHAGDGAASNAQTDCFDALKREYQTSTFQRFRLWLSFPRLLASAGVDDSTRGRSFLFFSLAAYAATCFRNGVTIQVPENGLISLNVPLDVLRLGSMSTRTTHPFYMARWNDLLAALGINCRLVNPYQYVTKGEMVSGCSNQPLMKDLAKTTVSCSSYTKGRWQKHPPQHCGFCVPCLIRRAAPRSYVGRVNPGGGYSDATASHSGEST